MSRNTYSPPCPASCWKSMPCFWLVIPPSRSVLGTTQRPGGLGPRPMVCLGSYSIPDLLNSTVQRLCLITPHLKEPWIPIIQQIFATCWLRVRHSKQFWRNVQLILRPALRQSLFIQMQLVPLFCMIVYDI